MRIQQLPPTAVPSRRGRLWQAAFGGPDQVLKYLARCTHRVAISNNRLADLRDGHVSFLWRDAHGGKQKVHECFGT